MFYCSPAPEHCLCTLTHTNCSPSNGDTSFFACPEVLCLPKPVVITRQHYYIWRRFSTLIGHCVSTMCACRNSFWFSNDINPLSSANQDQSTTFTTANQSPKAVRYSFVCRRSRRPTEVSNPYKRLIRAEYRSAKLQASIDLPRLSGTRLLALNYRRSCRAT